MSKFIKQFIFVSTILAILMIGGLVIYSATPSGKLKIAGGYQQYGSGRPVAWWKMDEASWNGTAGEVRDSIGTNNGTSAGGANTTSTAKFGRAGSFDGVDDYISVPDNATLRPANLTLSVWFYANGTQPIDTHYRRLVAKAYANTVTAPYISYGFLFNNAGTSICGVDSNMSGNPNNSNACTIFTPNTWNFVSMTFDGSTLKIYLNGVYKAQHTGLSAIQYSTGSILSGRSFPGSVAGRYNGLIDDVRIYNYALTADQVRQIYNETAKLKINPILGHDLDLNALYYAQAANNTVHDITTEDISISAWVNENTISGSGFKYMIGKNAVSSGNYYLAYVATNGGLIAGISDGTDTYSIGSTGVNIIDGKWHHVSVIFDRNDATQCKIFLDGQNVTGSKTGTIGNVDSVANAGILNVGQTSTGGRMSGRLRDVKLYYAAGDHWTDAQVLYQAQHPFDYTSNAGTLTDYWRLDEGTGTTLYGKPVGGNNLTLSNALAWTTQPKVKVSTGLVGYWKLDDNAANSTVIDYSGKRNNGTAYSGGVATNTSVFSSSTAMVGRAMSFDGVDDWVDAGNGASLNITQAMTIEAWVYPRATAIYPGIITKGGNICWGGAAWALALGYDSLQAMFEYRYQAGSGDPNYNRRYMAGSLILNTWSHVAVSFNKGVVTFYLNGNYNVSQTFSQQAIMDSSAQSVYIGRGNVRFNGLIDEVKIWNYARSGEEIKQDYERGLRGLP